MLFSVQELSKYYGASKRTMERRIAELRENSIFNKQSPGKFFNEEEARKIADLLKFTIKEIQK